jgi:GDPmannose 4,6-dehydratase
MNNANREPLLQGDLPHADGKTAIITGVSGQDGAYLADLLLQKGYRVIGTSRQTSFASLWRLRELGVLNHPNLHLVDFDITDLASALALVERFRPHEIYNFAAQSFVGRSFDAPTATAQANGMGALNLLEAVRSANPSTRYYQASSSEMFGNGGQAAHDESTHFQPCSPYGVSKLFAHWMTVNYRNVHGIHAVSGILFNHESPLRGADFVTRKISSAVAKVAAGQRHLLEVGNLDAVRDWGFAAEYVHGVWQMMQTSEPDTYVLATGRPFTVRDFVRTAFSVADVLLKFEGVGAQEVARDSRTGEVLLRVDASLLRRADEGVRLGDASKAKALLGWESRTTPESLCRMMVEADMRRTRLKSV